MLLLAGMISCSPPDREPEDGEPSAAEDLVQLSVELPGDAEVRASGGYLYDAETGKDRPPIRTFQSGSENKITGNFAKGKPVILRVHAAGYAPVYLFIPSYFEDELSVSVRPEALPLYDDPKPAVIGNFNRFDEFRAVEMEREGEQWTARIETDLDTLRYLITGVSSLAIPDLSADRVIAADDHTRRQAGTESVAIRDHDEPFHISFDPSSWPSEPEEATVRFDENTPVRTAGIATVYMEMHRQTEHIRRLSEQGADISEEQFKPFAQRLDSLVTRFDSDEVRQAADIALSRFADIMQPDEDWADAVLDDIAPGSDLWLMHQSAVGDLFSYSTRMEDVSQSLWDIYRQNPSAVIQAEALYNLLKFHYERGEDEEWYQAHFDLVREYPGHPRIGYSYQRGYAPESVVHIGRYFPGLEYRTADGSGPVRPAEIDGELVMIWFWDMNQPAGTQLMKDLAAVQDRFESEGLRIVTVALGDDSERVDRFHQHHGLNWTAAVEPLSASSVQVLGITSAPHLILLDRSNRVLFRLDEYLDHDDLKELAEYWLEQQGL